MRRGGTKRAAGLSALVLLLSACVPILAPVTVEPSTSVEDVELPPDAAYLDGEVYVVGAANVPDLRDSGLLGEAVALDPQLVPVGLSHNGELALSRPGELQILDLRGRGSSTVDVGRTAGEPAPAQAFEAFVAPDVVVWTEVERDSEGDLAHLWLAPRDGDGGARRVDTISIEFPEGFLAPRLRPIVVADRVYWNGIFSERDPGPALRQAPTDQSLPGTVLLSGALEPQVDRCAGPDELAFYYSEAGSTNVAPQLRRRVV
ncbi:MAG: hypothetical protein M3Y20_01250, partial [Actinomycetota bacterium]|nr:hypothetical protein [Actinomycetota bacterium]